MNKKQREFFLDLERNMRLKFNNKTVRSNEIVLYE